MILQPKTKFALALIEKWGPHWILCRKQDSIYFSPKPGPWALVQPPQGIECDSRWIHMKDDKHFQIVRLGGMG